MVTKRRWGRDIDGSKIGERHKREGTGTRKAAWWERRPNHITHITCYATCRSVQGMRKAKSAEGYSGHSFIRSSTRSHRFGRPSRPGAARITAEDLQGRVGRKPRWSLLRVLLLWKAPGPMTY